MNLFALVLVLAQTSPEAGRKLVEAEKFAEAERLLVVIAKQEPTNHAAMYWLGQAILNQEDRRAKEATGWFEKAVKLQPSSSDYHLWLGRAYGTQAQNANVLKQASLAGKTKEHFQKAVQLDPNSVEAHISMSDYYRMAPGVMGGSKDKARQEIEIIKRLDPWKGAQASIAFNTEAKDWATVERELRALKASHRDSTVIDLQVISMLQQSNQMARAFEQIDAVLRERPDDMRVVFQLGRAAAVSGQRLQSGADALQRYLQHKPGADAPQLWAAHFRLGNIYERMGKPDQAAAEYRLTLRDNPKHEDAKKALAKLGR